MPRRLCATQAHRPDRHPRIEGDSFASRPPPRNTPVVIPVVIHLLWHREADQLGDAQLLSQLDVLNEDFRGRNADRASVPAPFRAEAADTFIEFALARRDPSGRATTT